MTGPQIRIPEVVKTQQRSEQSEFGTCPTGAEERLSNAEHFLNIKNESQNVFSRLKAIEDKILYLESISPEYFDFFVSITLGHQSHPRTRCIPSYITLYISLQRQAKSAGVSTFSPVVKKKYSSEDIDMKLSNLKSKFMKR